jgi:hypothetical protein
MAAMQIAGLMLATILLGVGLVLNTAVLLYFTVRSLQHLAAVRRARTVQRQPLLAGAHR